MTPLEWFVAVKRQSPPLSGELLMAEGYAAHHLIPKSLLRKRGLHRLVWHPHNGIFITGIRHADHHSRKRPLTREELGEAWERVSRFAREIDDAGSERWATAYLLRTYPKEAS